MDQPRWQFASTQGGREDDVSSPLIETFEGDYNYFLAREILQNSLDAHNPEVDRPVKVVFDLVHFTQGMFPGYKELLDVFESAKGFWPPGNEKRDKFLNQALKCLKQSKIPVLKISDYHTKGLEGKDDDRTGSWYGLVKSIGSSNKQSGEGGSFGIGKGAPISASFLRTIFYSTKNIQDENIFQGVSEIVSFKDQEEDVKQGSGSYGLERQSSIRDRQLISPHMIRDERGLDIFIMGYKVEDEWQEKLKESVLRNFWLAIYEKKLSVVVDEEEIDASNLEEKLVEYFIDKPYKDQTKPEGNPLQFFKAFKSGRKFTEELEHLGKVKFYFNSIDQRLNRVAMIRKSKMVIYTKIFRWHAPYAGVFICDNDRGNEELRAMESPEHDIWDKDRYKEKGYLIEGELTIFIRNVLKSLARIKESGTVEIPELYKYLPFDKDGALPEGEGAGNKYANEEGDLESGKEIGFSEDISTTALITPYKVAVINTPIEGVGGDGVIKPTGERKTRKKTKQGGGEGDKKSLLDENTYIRVFTKEFGENSITYQMVIKSDIKGKCNIKLFAVGEEGNMRVNIMNVTDQKGNRYFSTGNRIIGVYLDPQKGLTLHIKVQGIFKLSLKPVAYDLQ